MGVTHYWEREIELPKAEFHLSVEDIKKLLEVIDIPLANAFGHAKPIITDEEISFNGIAGQNCEPFSFNRFQMSRRVSSLTFGYCKTEHMPYDFVVKCALIILSRYLKDGMKVSSDQDDKAWKDACDFCEKHFGYGKAFVLTKDKGE